jgi:hypothetical protein
MHKRIGSLKSRSQRPQRLVAKELVIDFLDVRDIAPFHRRIDEGGVQLQPRKFGNVRDRAGHPSGEWNPEVRQVKPDILPLIIVVHEYPHKYRNVDKVFLGCVSEISKRKLDVKGGSPGTLKPLVNQR